MMNVSTDKIDSFPVDDVNKLQVQLLKKQLEYVLNKSRFYQNKFKDAGIAPKDIKSLKDFKKIPFTTKEELRAYNDDFICVPNRKIVDIGATTGTTGNPIILPATMNDIKRLRETYLRSFHSIGITQDDIVQLSVAFDQLFPIGVTADSTLKKIGATVVRMGPGNTKRQLEIMKRIKATIIFCSPDYMFTLAETAKIMGLDPRNDFFLKKGLFHGHPLFDRNNRPTMLAKKIKATWGIECFSCYGSMEMFSGLFDCERHCGYHSHPDWLYLEIVNPKTGDVQEEGKEGELVVTTLQREAIPMIRYKQGDVTRMETAKCQCGRTSPRVMSIVGRANHMLTLKGTVVYPQQIEEILMQEPEITHYALEAYRNDNDCDAIRIMVSLQKNGDTVMERIKQNLKAKIRISPPIEVLSSQEILKLLYRHGNRKPQKFWDLRDRPPSNLVIS